MQIFGIRVESLKLKGKRICIEKEAFSCIYNFFVVSLSAKFIVKL